MLPSLHGPGARVALREWLPRGGMLTDAAWAPRHRWILKVLWFHVIGLGMASVATGLSLAHTLVEMVLVGAFGVAAMATRRHRRTSTLLAALGLLTASAVLVHLFDGRIEMHFSYFVMVGVVTLYQDWLPLLASIGYVVVQHGIGGLIDPSIVYDHPAAVEHPWQWAAAHGGFVLAMSCVGLVSWRMNEIFQVRLAERESRLEEAQSIACLGNWSIDCSTGTVECSEELKRLLAFGDDAEPSLESFLAHVSSDDRDHLRLELVGLIRDATRFERDFRVVSPSGEVRWLHGRGDVNEVIDGTVTSMSGTAQDITTRKRAEIELEETLSQLSATLDSTADGILVVSIEGVVTNLNKRFAEMFGVPEGLTPPVDSHSILMTILPQIVDPDEFILNIGAMIERADNRTEMVVGLVDGRTLECYCNPQTIYGRTVGRVWSVRDITERTRLEHALVHQAFHDSLTNLANKALFGDRVGHALARAERSEKTVAVLFIDLDGFKTINDGLGHTAGDELLVAVADRFRGCLRQSDTAARLGGDEFAVLIEDVTDHHDLEVSAQRLIDVLKEPFRVAERDVYVRASIGIAEGSNGATFEQLLRNADLAMYAAKRHGRNRFESFEPDAHADPLAKLDLETAMRRGLDADEFSVHYQPIVIVSTGQVVGAEALARWTSAQHGSISPTIFIPVAESLGLVGDIGELVLATACTEVRQWQLDGIVADDFSISVNLSTKQMDDRHLVERIAATLERSGLPPRNLVLEITESGVMTENDKNIQILHGLRELGVRVAIDDFGTGYSSLSYLQSFPVDILKIDRAFVAAIQAGTTDASLAPTILLLAETLNLRVIAEGVETKLQATTLDALGCQLAQGYLFAHPVSAAEMHQLLIERASSSTAPAFAR